MSNFFLSKQHTALLIIDMQDKVFNAVERGQDILQNILKMVKGFQILNLPIFISEQYPQGLGSTLLSLRTALGSEYQPLIKSSFSCADNEAFCKATHQSAINQWIIVGIEAHVCVLQTVKGLLKKGKEVAVLNDAISSRSIYDFSTSIAEMRDNGARITCSETVLFELLGDYHAPEFKQISQLIKSHSQTC